MVNKRKESDEYYVITLCDNILNQKAEHQATFDFLKGDSGKKLPVDAYYYKNLNLVVEYHESQHYKPTPFFDTKLTVSGVTRGEQRKLYDKRRIDMLSKEGIKLVVIKYCDFGTTKKINRENEIENLEVVKRIFKENGIQF